MARAALRRPQRARTATRSAPAAQALPPASRERDGRARLGRLSQVKSSQVASGLVVRQAGWVGSGQFFEGVFSERIGFGWVSARTVNQIRWRNEVGKSINEPKTGRKMRKRSVGRESAAKIAPASREGREARLPTRAVVGQQTPRRQPMVWPRSPGWGAGPCVDPATLHLSVPRSDGRVLVLDVRRPRCRPPPCAPGRGAIGRASYACARARRGREHSCPQRQWH